MKEKLKGQFWIPGNEKLKHFGEIILSTAQQRSEIVIYGTFSEFDQLHQNINFHKDIPSLYGYTKDKKFVTLLDLRIIDANLSPATAESSAFKSEHRLSFRQFICGPIQLPFGSSINRISITAQFMEAWGKTNPIQMKLNATSDLEDQPSKSYHLRPGEPVAISFEPDSCTFYDYLSHNQKVQTNHLQVKQQNCLHFIFQQNLEINQLYTFLRKFREFYTLITGVNLGFDLIIIRHPNTNAIEYQYEFDGNILNNSYSFINSSSRILGLKELSSSKYLKHFFSEYDYFRLPLAHYMGYLNSNKSDNITFVQPFVSALEIIYNKCYRDEKEDKKDINPTLNEILETYKLSPKHKQFLLASKLAKTYRDLHLKDKIASLIGVSRKLTQLVDNPIDFTRKVLDLRHYLVHEVDKGATDLSLLNNPLLLDEHIVKLKIILEYHLLLMMGMDKEIIEKRIDCTMPNFVYFSRF